MSDAITYGSGLQSANPSFGEVFVPRGSELTAKNLVVMHGIRKFTGRSMDWVEDMQTNLWAFPRGMKRDGGLGKGSLEWTSKYGSIVASVYEGGSADGMNEKGLVANMLYLAESEYPADDDKRPSVCISAWAQYFLDNFASVEDAVTETKKESFKVVPVVAPNGMKGSVQIQEYAELIWKHTTSKPKRREVAHDA